MLRCAVFFLVAAIVAAVFGFGVISAYAWVARILLPIFAVLFFVTLIIGRPERRLLPTAVTGFVIVQIIAVVIACGGNSDVYKWWFAGSLFVILVALFVDTLVMWRRGPRL